MDTQTTRRGIPTGVIWGGFGVLVWAAFTIFAAGGTAHADEKDDPLKGLTSIVSNTVTAVTTPVTKVVEPVVTKVVQPVVTKVVEPVVTKVVEPVVTKVATPVATAVTAPVKQVVPEVVSTVTHTVTQVPVAGSVASPVLQTVTDTTRAVTTPVTNLLSSSPVSQITTPIIDIVTGLPIAGNLISGLGVTGLVEGVVGVVDGVVGVVGDVTGETLPPIIDALNPQNPTLPCTPVTPGEPGTLPWIEDPVSGTVGAAGDAIGDARVAPADSRQGAPPGHHGASAPASNDLPRGFGAAPPGAPVSPTSSAGSGGSATSVAARLSDDDAPPLRAWKRVSGVLDDVLPASPIADADVSPD